ncbi:GmrSD restriction endonuclease domain-containing protein [Thermomonospora catenispora]|uniref:GmrSD restriction endonuclease domain-containing protein n=1 Tax=Thermomonospora catenispora TaxID=2493090 RepID=UPI0011233C52|nr:DUF262 domain-containing protein [Thermomonospora catenispora]TNY37470.1 DUF262 domain-containing protein [Thermomonospora catenispora]
MATTLYRTADYSVSHLIESIDRGDIALPDIQRPFVWKATKVRSLFDSMHKGFPVGFLLFWETDAEPGARRIGTGDAVPRHVIVDGQQRLTSLYAVMRGKEVVRENYEKTRIRIAFRPADATFKVTDAATEQDPEYIPDISVLWTAPSFHRVVREFIKGLRERREVSEDEEDRLVEALNRLRDLSNYSSNVVELSKSTDEEQVAEIFVRINSAGVTLNQSDFILTLMSVFWEKGRRDLEEFCRGARQPSLDGTTAFNWYLRPQPDQLLRVSVALAFRRAVLKDVYTLLRGKTLEGHTREEQFARLEQAQAQVLDLGNWHEFLLCLERAGFRGGKMITSETAIVFTYALWLLGRTEFAVPAQRLREVIARWFFMAHTTSRYTGSFETQAERDFRLLDEVAPGDADGFCQVLDRVVDNTLTADYWNIRLPDDLETSASRSPNLSAYLAALNIHDAPVLLSRTSVRAAMDPAVTSRRGINRDHLFRRTYLQEAYRITTTGQINQIANMTLVEWPGSVPGADPSRYWPAEVEASGLTPEEVARQMHLHALPEGWHEMDYQSFLKARRVLMAQVIREAFQLLRDPGYTAAYPAPGRPVSEGGRAVYGVDLSHLLEHGLLEPGCILIGAENHVSATVTSTGQVEFEGQIYDSPSGAAKAAAGGHRNGWEFWSASLDGELTPLAILRLEYVQRTGQSAPSE